MKQRKSKGKRNHRGQAMVEFAFSLPFFLLIMITILYFGRYFYLKQVIFSACQEAARSLSTSANLNDAAARRLVTGFDENGALVEATAPVAVLLGNANLLSQGNTGDLPAGASIRVLPYEATGTDPTLPDGTIAVKIDYPFVFIGSPFDASAKGEFTGTVSVYSGEGGSPVIFPDNLISEIAVSGQQIAGDI